MAKIKASLADVSTEFQPIEPGLYEFEITKIEEVEKNGETAAFIFSNTVTTAGDFFGRNVRDYVAIQKKDGSENEVGLSTLKRYFEVTHGKEEVAGWDDDQFDTDELIGKTFQAQVKIDSYTPQGETTPRQNNKFSRMEEL